ncbi:hypothetical protein DY218_30065 [Streptomyces triticagri]|uniref:DUF485 domain-containing protein n=1 Tax=Streptomyces triticagri TaxID=2293568 RepID=A0A372LWD3_9ACTN|nr:hypothetical protein [Streptomyces triticagri]RFU82976.1 hypothetical protein DY218_30065 [Streptomyces triticagri]
MSAEPTPRREVVTGEPRRVHRLPGHPTQSEIDEQTTLGAAYVRSLMRSQLRAGLTAFGFLALTVVTLPLFFDALGNASVVWIVLGFACYPVLVGIAWWYVHRAERNERDFARLVHGVHGPERPPGRPAEGD